MTRSLARNDRKRDVEDAVPYGVQQSYGDGGTPSPTTAHRTRPQGGDTHTSPRRTNAHFAAGHMGPALQGTPVMQDGTSGRRPLQRLIAPVRRGRCPHRPAGQMRILRRDTWVPPYRVRRSCRTGRRDAVPYNGSSHPSAGGDAHIAPPDKCAFCGGTHGSRPTGYAGHAGRDVGTPSPTTAHRTRPQGAMPTHRPAGQMRILRRDTWVPPYRVRRSCRTGRRGRRPLQRLTVPIRRGVMPTHRPAGSTKRQAQAPASLSKKSGWTFSTSWQAKSQNKNDILFCDFGRCGG